MGLFNNYTKPGPGIDKDAPKKKGIFLYFELFFRKFFKICQLNMLYFVCSLPNIIITFFIVMRLLGNTFLEATNNAFGAGSDSASIYLMLLNTFAAMLFVTLWGTGPTSAAYAYVTRCFTREEHSWIFSDFFKKLKENFKQSVIVMIIDYVVMIATITAIMFYWNLYVQLNSFVWVVMTYISCMLFIIYTFMHFYIYQLMVTFECKFIDLIKNSVMLAFGKAPMNLVLAMICAFVLVLVFAFVQPLFAVFIIFLLVYSLARYPIEFYAARTLMKLIEASEEK